MSEHSNLDPQECRQLMSSLADGDIDPGKTPAACALWSADARAREAWHTYHLIGDALRSEDLASRGERDEIFLSSLRLRLATEPAVMAPTSSALLNPPPRRVWRIPAALVAGAVVVAGVLVASRMAVPGTDRSAGTELAEAPAAEQDPRLLGDPTWQLVDGKLIRDARLDAYLRAHRGGPVAMPGGATGRFETVVLER